MYKPNDIRAFLDSFSQVTIVNIDKVTSLQVIEDNEVYDLPITEGENSWHGEINWEINLRTTYKIVVNNRHYMDLEIGLITTTPEFLEKYQSLRKLGVECLENETRFSLWTPVASKITLCYEQGAGNWFSKVMEMDTQHFYTVIAKNLEGNRYYYIVEIGGKVVKVVDPYAYNTTLNGEMGIIVDISRYQFTGSYHPNNKDDMLIYETSVCDFTSDEKTNFKYPGKYLGFAERGKKTEGGNPIGIDHLLRLKVSHIQLMPIYDFGSVIEELESDDNYNWGYDPHHYNVPEGSYVIGNRFDSRITECKQLITDLKDLGFGVIMDVVYNHVYDPTTFNFNLLCPNYFFRFNNRQFANGSFCGNEIASERPMVKRYIIDTAKNWVQIYGIDGLRMDLMGLMDIGTINELEQTLRKVNPNIIIYGEGWSMPCQLAPEVLATQTSAMQIPNIGFFNDDLRNFIKGDNSDFEKMGYIQTKENSKMNSELKLILAGESLRHEIKYASPFQLINYLSCHDDHTLYDYLAHQTTDEEELTKQIILGYELLFASEGIPFVHSGCEFKRSKNGKKNTYNSPRSINAIKWGNIDDNNDIINVIIKARGRKYVNND